MASKFSILFLLSVLLLLQSCSSNSIPEYPLIYVESVHLDATNEYDLINCTYESKKIRIVVKRLQYSDCKRIIKERTYYKIDLHKIDTVVHATTNFHPHSPGQIVIEYGPNDPYFSGDKIVGNLYSSPDLDGICITNLNIFHYP